MSDPATIAEIPTGCVWQIDNTGVMAAMTGVARVGVYSDGRVTLVYTDSSREHSREPMDVNREIPCLVECIEHVQGQRVPAE